MIELVILGAFGIVVFLFLLWAFIALQDWTEDDYMPPHLSGPDDSHTWHQSAEHSSAIERIKRADLKSITRGD